MTEDDTFLKLKQISFDNLDIAIKKLERDEFNAMCKNSELKESFLNKHGWTTVEFDRVVRSKF